jgi:uncharacterized protein YjdB
MKQSSMVKRSISAGLVILLLLLSVPLYPGAGAAASEDRLPLLNPGFEESIAPVTTKWSVAEATYWTATNWGANFLTYSVDSTEKSEGNSSLRMSYTGASEGKGTVVQNLDGDFGGKELELSYWVKTENVVSSTEGAFVRVQLKNNTGAVVKTTVTPFIKGTNDWQRISVSTVAPADSTTVVLTLFFGLGTGTVWYDDVQLKDLTAADSENPELAQVTLTGSKSLAPGETEQLDVGGLLSDDSPADMQHAEIIYESSAPDILTVDANGIMKAVAIGTAVVTVTVTIEDITKSAQLQVDVRTVRTPYRTFTASDLNEWGGGLTWNSWGLSSTKNNSWAALKGIDFGNEENIELSLEVRAAVDQIHGGNQVEVRLDSLEGTLAGTITISSSGSFGTQQLNTAVIDSLTGVHDVYFIFKGNATTNGNVTHFAFMKSSAPEPSVLPSLDFEQAEAGNVGRWGALKPVGWTGPEDMINESMISLDTAEKRSGQYALKVYAPQQKTHTLTSTLVPIEENMLGKSVLFSFWVKSTASNGHPEGRMIIYAEESGILVEKKSVLTGYDRNQQFWNVPWSPYYAKFTMPQDAAYARFVLATNPAVGSIHFDDIQYEITDEITVPTSVTVTPASTSIIQGNEQQMKAVVAPTYADNKNVIWSSSDDEVAVVDETGKVQAISPGTVTIIAKTVSGEITGTAELQVFGPGIQQMKVDGNPIVSFNPVRSSYYVAIDGTDFSLEQVLPEIELIYDNGATTDAEVTYEGGRYGTAAIEYVTADGQNRSYSIDFRRVGDPDLLPKHELTAEQVTASTHQDPNVPQHTIDGIENTRWAAELQQWIQYDLGESQSVEAIGLHLVSGDARQYYFEVYTSQNATDWTLAYNGLKGSGGESAGLTATAKEIFQFEEQTARYVRIVGHGNSVNGWNNYTEVAIYPSMETIDFGIWPTSLSIATDKTRLDINESATLNSSVLPENAGLKRVSWTSSDPSIARVDREGRVTGVSEGTTTIIGTTLVGEQTDRLEIDVTGEFYPEYPARQFDHIYDGLELTDGRALTIKNMENVLIINTEIANVKGLNRLESALNIEDSKNVVIKDSYIHDIDMHGIRMDALQAGRTENLIVDNVTIARTGFDGISQSTTGDTSEPFPRPITGIVIKNSTIHDVGLARTGSPKHAVYGKGEGILFENNTVYNAPWGCGFSVRNAATLRGNLIYNTSGAGICLTEQTGIHEENDETLVENNVIYLTGNYEDFDSESSNTALHWQYTRTADDTRLLVKKIVVRHNTLIGSPYANSIYSVITHTTNNPDQRIEVYNNILVDQRGLGQGLHRSDQVDVNLNNVVLNDLEGFVNPEQLDFRLKSGHPAIGAANSDLEFPSEDLAGNARTADRLDAGAYQFVVEPTATPTPTASPDPDVTPAPTASIEPEPTPTATANPPVTPTSAPTATPGTVQTVIQLQPVLSGEVAKASLSLDQLNAVFAQNNQVIIEMAEVEGAVSYRQELPAELFISGNGSKQIRLKTASGTLTLTDKMLAPQQLKGVKNVEVVIGQADVSSLQAGLKKKLEGKAIVELAVYADGERISWKNNKSPVTVSIPYTPTAQELKRPEHIAIWYIDGESKVTRIPSGRYDAATGTVSFETSHFSTYAVAYEVRSFEDLKRHGWAKDAIEVLASKGIVNGVTEKHFSPAVSVTRADFLLMLMRGLHVNSEAASSFKDVPGEAYYFEAVAAAKELGIIQGTGDELFHPLAAITRQDMMVMTHRAIEAAGKHMESTGGPSIEQFKDANQVADYAKNSASELLISGLIQGDDAQLHPLQSSTRAEAAVLIYRMYQRVN